MPTLPNLDHLVSQLLPYLTNALPEIATDLASKGLETGVAGTARGLASLTASLSRRFRQTRASSKAHRYFEQAWSEATTTPEREQVVRDLLKAEPRFADALNLLMLRRDFVIAVASYCDRLPALDETLRLSEVYVPIPLHSLTGIYAADRGEHEILASGNHIIEGEGGSGKSTFLRHLARMEACALLDDQHAVAFDDLRIPCLIHAEDLIGAEDFATLLRRAATSTLKARLRQQLPADFFVPNATEGHQKWLILVDGFDEIDDRHRRDVWDAIRLHAEQDSGFRFIIGTRPEAMASVSADTPFVRWSMASVGSDDQKVFASSYILDAGLRAKFNALLAHREFRYIGNTPLFLTMSAQLFAETGEIYDRKIDLYERYLAHLLGKVVNNDRKKIAALTDLLQIIAEGDYTIRVLVRQHGNVVENVADAHSALSAEAELRKLLDRTALLRRSGDRLRFSHDLFRSYYRAFQLAGSIAPAPRILRKVEPFREGWAVVEQLLLRWDRNDLNIEPVLRSLLEYGEKGLECAAHVIAGAKRAEHGKVAVNIAERFLREAKDEEPTLVAQRMLTMLAEANEAVCNLLIDELNSTFLMSDTFVAECLLDGGGTDEALEHLLWIAERHDGESWGRITAAELLLKHGYREEALETLRDVARDGDELWSRAEAASILY